MALAGNAFEAANRDLKVASFVRAAEYVAESTDGEESADERLLTVAEILAGRFGPDRAAEMWAGVRCLANELIHETGISHGKPSATTQTLVIGTLYGTLAKRAFYAENPERVFAGLAPVK
jgi:hypothetical protein